MDGCGGKTCCFIGHRKIVITDELNKKMHDTIEKLIENEKVYTFLFGSKSAFNRFAYKIVTEIKSKYPQIRRIYVRAEFADISEDYKNYLLEGYEDTYYPDKIIGAGKQKINDQKFSITTFRIISQKSFALNSFMKLANPTNLLPSNPL